MAGYGNAGGVPPDVIGRMDDLKTEESRAQTEEERVQDQSLWDEYRSTRPHLANTPSAEAGRVLMSNRKAIVTDTLKRSDTLKGTGLPLDETGLDNSMKALAALLIYGSENDGHYEDLNVAAKEAANVNGVVALSKFLDPLCRPVRLSRNKITSRNTKQNETCDTSRAINRMILF